MSRKLAITTYGGGKECFSNAGCPLFDIFLRHLDEAPYDNVFRRRLIQLQQRNPRLLKVNELNNNATLVCNPKNCPIYSQLKIETPVISVLHLRPVRSNNIFN